MNKFELKSKLIETSKVLNNLAGELMSSSIYDEKIAEYRQEVLTSMEKTDNIIKKIIYNIH